MRPCQFVPRLILLTGSVYCSLMFWAEHCWRSVSMTPVSGVIFSGCLQGPCRGRRKLGPSLTRRSMTSKGPMWQIVRRALRRGSPTTVTEGT
ncbi:hypothetical protein B0H65DRAFT_455120 [Neurospora tetraspora]|uniref:Uncharacterized protein n=1 Tax=Neurospora tetraspora TaxID=94610 RepID=A0AAE0MUB7_9PEZI|nr:hypothetical protein B0H65DRAFT_455120 [Neurospora tetraspora]